MLAVVMVLGFISAATAIPCEEANLRCMYRTGCGNALKGYVMACSTILHETPPDQCPEGCQNALIALTSTDEGKDLMTVSTLPPFTLKISHRYVALISFAFTVRMCQQRMQRNQTKIGSM